MGATAAEVVVVGGGLIGVSVAAELALRGTSSIVVVERGSVASGATGKSSGVVRCHYGVPELACMAWWSLATFENASDVLGADVGFRQVGYVVAVDDTNATALRSNVALHQRLGIDAVVVGVSELTSLWPGVATDDLAVAAYEPRGGYADAYSLAMAQAKRARGAGAVIHQYMPVRALTSSPDGSRITGVVLDDSTELAASQVVLAAGPWSVELAATVGVDLPIRSQRETVVLVEPPTPLPPTLPVFSDLVKLQYSRPDGSGQLLVGNSDHASPEYADPDRCHGTASHAYLESAIMKIVQRFPVLADGAAASSYVGCYDVTPDYNPVIGPVGPDGLFVAAGFSGHGFKISPAVGELVASMIIGRASAVVGVDPHVFRLSRFAEARPLLSQTPYVGAGTMR